MQKHICTALNRCKCIWLYLLHKIKIKSLINLEGKKWLTWPTILSQFTSIHHFLPSHYTSTLYVHLCLRIYWYMLFTNTSLGTSIPSGQKFQNQQKSVNHVTKCRTYLSIFKIIFKLWSLQRKCQRFTK